MSECADHQRLQYEEANKKLNRALDLLNSINPESEPHASPIKHQILMSRGLNHSALGRAQTALVDLDEAARVLEKTEDLDIDPGNLGSKVSIRRGTRSRGLDGFLLDLPVPWEQFRQA